MTNNSRYIEDFDASLESAAPYGVELEKEDSRPGIDVPFDPSKIKVTTERRTIDLIVSRIAHGEIDLAPEFQRRARLWSLSRRSKLIESLLLRIPLPVFYVSANESDDWVVVDGLQRITTISDFWSDQFSLQGLEYLSHLEKATFSTLDRSMRRRILETELVFNVIQPGTPEEVMMNIFKRINTGGLPLNNQEIRNAVNKGPVRSFLKKLATSREFVAATSGSVKDDRMDAQELVLRYLAFKNLDWAVYKSSTLDSFLNSAMKVISSKDNFQLADMESDFKRTMERCAELLEGDAFRKPSSTSKRNPVSKPLFEAWAVSVSGLSEIEYSVVLANKKLLKQEFWEAYFGDQEFINSVTFSTGRHAMVYKRMETVSMVMRKVYMHGAGI